jgi:hypothetical protein
MDCRYAKNEENKMQGVYGYKKKKQGWYADN